MSETIQTTGEIFSKFIDIKDIVENYVTNNSDFFDRTHINIHLTNQVHREVEMNVFVRTKQELAFVFHGRNSKTL